MENSIGFVSFLSNVVPIPGSKNKERIVENLDASKVELTGMSSARWKKRWTDLRRTDTGGDLADRIEKKRKIWVIYAPISDKGYEGQAVILVFGQPALFVNGT
ncbi:MAG: hypothetical protein LUF92_06840 [Clostridiales bacterium]|nr:hypothetical protein [Clostridiales bacterium]